MGLSGEYVVLFKHPEQSIRDPKVERFKGFCENFHPSGKCAFRNEKNEMLVVRYEDIIQMKLTK